MFNPFRPTAGAEPPRIIGRDEVVSEFIVGLQTGVGAPSRLMRITGPRCSGKTVLLCDLREKASELGWRAVSVSAGPRLLENLAYELEDAMGPSKATFGLNLGVASAKLEMAKPSRNIRALMRQAASGYGLFIAVARCRTPRRTICARLPRRRNFLIGEKVDVALAFAGLSLADVRYLLAMTED